MALKTQKWNKMLELFFENPNKKFTVREISGKTKIPSSSVQRYLERLRKEGFITKENRAIVNSGFKFKKASFLIEKMHSTGLIEHLEEKLHPSAVIVFGSVRKRRIRQ